MSSGEWPFAALALSGWALQAALRAGEQGRAGCTSPRRPAACRRCRRRRQRRPGVPALTHPPLAAPRRPHAQGIHLCGDMDERVDIRCASRGGAAARVCMLQRVK